MDNFHPPLLLPFSHSLNVAFLVVSLELSSCFIHESVLSVPNIKISLCKVYATTATLYTIFQSREYEMVQKDQAPLSVKRISSYNTAIIYTALYRL